MQNEALSQTLIKEKEKVCISVVECMPSMCGVLGSIPNMEKDKTAKEVLRGELKDSLQPVF